MNTLGNLIEKLFIICLCLYSTYRVHPQENLVLYFLISLIFSSLLEISNNIKVKTALYAGFIFLCLYNNLFILYIPIIVYDMIKDFKMYTLFILALVFSDFYPENLILFIFSAYMSLSNFKQGEMYRENVKTRDRIKEDSLLLEKYNEQLKKDKDKNVHIAILTERNRIAKELHDAVGHAISSSILQVESIKIISNEKPVVEKLDILQNTLTKGMNDVRISIHNLHNESMDLKEQIENHLRYIANLDIELVYKIDDNLSYDLKYDILSVVKEGITNVVKHSNADKLKIALIEQTKFYTIVVKDNGSSFNKENFNKNQGMGLLSIKEVAHKYNGFMNTSFDNGFKIHLTLIKMP